MKISKFNSYFDYLEKKVGFNSFTSQFIAIEPELLEILFAATRENNLEGLKTIHPAFYSFLLEKGFIIEETIDEFEQVKALSQKTDNDESVYRLIINPTMNCNFKCWYCYETHIKGSKMSSTNIMKVQKFVENLFIENKEIKEFQLSWFGGEPLLYFDKVITPLLKVVHGLSNEHNIKLTSGITTNGLLINDQVIKTSKQYGLNFYQITLDGNQEQHDKVRFINKEKGSYKKIVENIILLVKNNITASVRINCSPETFDGLNDSILDFEILSQEERKYLHFDFHKVWQVEEEIEEKLHSSRNFFRDKGFSVSRGVFDTVTSSCYADKRNQATINYNGEVFKCTARDFTGTNKEGDLGDDGKLIWNEKREIRLNSKFKNKPCRDCKILPICGGGCTQQAIEHAEKDYCVHDFDEQKKLNVVKNKFYQSVLDV